MKKRALYKGKAYEMIAMNDEMKSALYRNGNSYLVATDSKVILEFQVTSEIKAQEASKKLGYMGY